MLAWSTENPNTVTIDPEVGNVSARGSKQVKPSATTTYTLTVRGPNGDVTKTVKVTVAGTTERAAAATPATPENAAAAPKPTPRMADGKPDLSGVYNSSSFNSKKAPRNSRSSADPTMPVCIPLAAPPACPERTSFRTSGKSCKAATA